MLVIFLGDVGHTTTFDIQLAMGSVSQLQAAIATRLRIPVDKQVLLSSQGETLQPSARVASFSTGTETNPIFLFNKSNIESVTPPVATVHSTNDGKLLTQLDASLRMRPSQETVVRQAQLASEFHRHASEFYRSCCQLVQEQALLQRAWKAVIANLEQIGRAFSDRLQSLHDLYNEILASKVDYIEQLQQFDFSLSELQKISLPTVLLKSQEFSSLLSPTTKESFELIASKTEASSEKAISLLDWISAHDSKCHLEQLGVHCRKSLDQLSASHLEEVMSKMAAVQESLNNNDMKEVSGLDERLHLLQERLTRAAALQQEQSDVSQGFQQNKMRAQSLRDPSVFPDLCAGLEGQLTMLANNHSQLKELRSRFASAKRELCANLHTRLRWVMFVQKNVADSDSNILLRCESLKKLKKRFDVIEQVNSASRMFIVATVEVVRRRHYNKHFITWCDDVIKCSRDTQDAERVKREKFNEMMGMHFVQCLFSGLGDNAPSFSARQPTSFTVTETLPAVTEEDLEMLRKALPSLAEYAVVPEFHHLHQSFFKSKTTDQHDDKVPQLTEEIDASTDEVTCLKEEISELKGMLEEGRAQVEKDKEEMRTTIERSFREETERLKAEKDTLLATSQTEWQQKLAVSVHESSKANEELCGLRGHVDELQQQLAVSHTELSVKNELAAVLEQKNRALDEELELEKSERVRGLEEEMSKMRQRVEEERAREREEWEGKMEREKREVIETMNSRHRQDMEALKEQQRLEQSANNNKLTAEWEAKCTALENDVKHLQSRQLEFETQQKESERPAIFKLKSEYETRIATLQTEKLHELEVAKRKNESLLKTSIAKAIESGREEARRLHDVEMEEMKRAVEAMRHELDEKKKEGEDKERKVNEMAKKLEMERQEWQKKRQQATQLQEDLSQQVTDLTFHVKQLEEQVKKSRSPSVEQQSASFHSDSGMISDEGAEGKSDVSRELMERERDLKEAQHEAAREREKARKMQEDKEQFEKKLVKRGMEMEARYHEMDTTVNDLTRMLAERGVTYDVSRLSKTYQPRVILQDFKTGDLAFFIYSEDIDTYVAYSISPIRYFLHSNSQAELRLQPSPGEARKAIFLGFITDREYCQCKKKTNRFKLPIGAKFYRLSAQEFVPRRAAEGSPSLGHHPGTVSY